MRRLWKRDGEFAELERELRARRSQPPDGLVRSLARRTRRRSDWLLLPFRLGYSAALVLAAAVVFAYAGGVGAVQSAPHALPRIFANPAADQYRGLCGTVPPYGARCVVVISDTTVDEPAAGCTNNAVFPLKVTGNNDQAITVTYHTVDGTAIAGEDYVAQPPGSTTTIPPHTRTWQILVPVCRDLDKTSDYFYVVLDTTSPNATIGGSGQAKGTIKDKFK
jgi:hypothetical protein